MMLPIRCYSCGRVIASDYERYKQLVAQGEAPRKAMDSLGLERFCCRRMILGHVELLKESAVYE